MTPRSDIPWTTAEQTNWVVITGAPCSGKTSVIEALENSGHRVVHEAARAYIDQQIASGTPLEKIKSDILSFERRILQKKVTIEQGLPRKELIFLDRAVPDSIAYYLLDDLHCQEAIDQSKLVRYRRIFLFERLKFKKDGIRTENRALARRIEGLLIKGYEDLGYEIFRVPLLSVNERVALVLEQLKD